ncbi:hypothetical protein SDRG_01781 [Saprolegnia diclina VS20]|uniref:PH domain-containing protein n=1 Tax=Saprolegnia diclina (strain VS20) TaxID=1156394 RepID=T0QRE2_SAPDV|nr:hypothetical protein SDRG_01781 [Saprolegnia diclina VS20]EQC40709.1 hypothetical protein SDRG_01781 [Saprolegnia diclina VS20]|eukprot:XP_008605553.1 hypothetical protein SDRG_01781 [Saprolegnia diclina VS20]
MNLDLTDFKQTSCEGYVTKRGHVMKSWRRRYMVLDGDTLKVSYFDSKTIYKSDKPKEKGSFILAEIEKHDYSDEGGGVKPYGFKLVGHAPGHGYKEFCVYVETAKDQTQWLEVAHNALGKNVAPQASADQRATALLGHRAASGFLTSAPVQLRNVNKTKEELLRKAIVTLEHARTVGDNTVSEMGHNAEMLDIAEANMDYVGTELDRGDNIIKKMTSPFFYYFSSSKSKKKGAGSPKSKSARSHLPQTPMNSPTNKKPSGPTSKTGGPTTDAGDDELDQLSKILASLEVHANTISTEVERTTEQIDRIQKKMVEADERVVEQSAKVHAIQQKNKL